MELGTMNAHHLSPSTHWDHGPLIIIMPIESCFEPRREFLSKCITHSTFFISDSMSRSHVFLGHPRFLFHCGLRVRAGLVMMDLPSLKE